MPLLITVLQVFFFLAGSFIVSIAKQKDTVETVSISIALGALVSLLSFDLIPEIFFEENSLSTLLIIIFILVGIAFLYVFDKFIPNHDVHDISQSESMEHIGKMSVIAIALHNVIEGMTVFNVSSGSISAGLSLAIGVGLHNIPMGMLIFATLSRQEGARKYILTLLTALATFVGGVLMLIMQPLLSATIITALICVTVGMVLFIVLFELIPSVLHTTKLLFSLLFILLGFVIVFISMLL